MGRHLYTKGGKEAYDKGKRDARKEDLIFSVTEQLKVLANPGLAIWGKNNLLDAVQAELADVPEVLDLIGPWDQFVNNVKVTADLPSKTARERGTTVHAETSHYLNQEPYDGSDDCTKAIVKWCEANVVTTFWTEKVLVHPEFRWAGKADAYLEHQEHGAVLVDWKTSAFKNGKARFWDSYCYQLAAYRECMPENGVGCLSVLVDTGTPGEAEIQTKLWTEEELARGLKIMDLSAELFALIEKYDPSELNMN